MLTSASRSPSERPRKKGAQATSSARAKPAAQRASKAAAAPKRRKPTPLSTRQRAYLRGLGHHLQPVVLLGKDGISAGLLGALDVALDQHELIKVRLSENTPGERGELAQRLAEGSLSALVQVLGRVVLLYRRRPEALRSPRPSIQLPADPA
jgi:RNA-binding protein